MAGDVSKSLMTVALVVACLLLANASPGFSSPDAMAGRRFASEDVVAPAGSISYGQANRATLPAVGGDVRRERMKVARRASPPTSFPPQEGQGS